MSLPDTIFIFVLALIIFGPKKLPEIGRQLGKLVGEFRRASNEFKFQIEEELRQAESTDRNTITPGKKEPETPASAETLTEAPDSATPDLPFPEETLPIGQHPNIDTITQNLSSPESTESEASPGSAHKPERGEGAFHAEINPAAGAEPRTTSPYSTLTTDEPEPPANHQSSATDATSLPNHEPADPYVAPAVADVTHG